MRGRVLKSFAGRDGQGNRVSHGQGDIIEIPPGVDWVKAGLVEEIKGKPAAARRQKATLETAEKRHAEEIDADQNSGSKRGTGKRGRGKKPS